MTASDIQARLKNLFETQKSASELITRLSKLSPSNVDGSIDTSQERVELSAEIHQTLKELEEDFELLKQEAEDFTSTGGANTQRRRDSEKDTQRITVTTQVDRLGEDLKLARSHFRRAQLAAKRAEESAKRKEREALFAGVSTDPAARGPGKRRGQEKLSQDELLVAASADVTAALRRTHQLMSSEYERSEFARETLRNSTEALNQLSENYSTLDSLLAGSRDLIKTLVTSQKSDTWYLENAFKLLVVLIVYLIARRIFWYPIKLFLLFPVKVLWRALFAVVQVAVGILGGKASETGLARDSFSSSSRPPLKVQPSASNRPPPIMSESASMKTGGGGAKGRKKAEKDDESLVEEIGRMTEDTQREGDENKEGDDQGEGSKHDEDKHDETGDGTKLRARRPDEKPNPKKRMFEEPPAEQRARDEL